MGRFFVHDFPVQPGSEPRFWPPPSRRVEHWRPKQVQLVAACVLPETLIWPVQLLAHTVLYLLGMPMSFGGVCNTLAATLPMPLKK